MKTRPNDTQLFQISIASAKAAQLLYVDDSHPGIRRKRRGRGFQYVDDNSQVVSCEEVLTRIRALVIPPAWSNVWICAHPDGHMQATGRDQRGRKLYIYHSRWREVRDEAKYEKVAYFAEAPPVIRRRIASDLRRPGLPRQKVLATIVKLMEVTLIRVGNDEYARTNGSFGLTTLRDHHVRVVGNKIQFDFRGKSGIEHEISLENPRLAAIVRECQDLPGQELFQYYDESGAIRGIGSSDVNEYLHGIAGNEFTAKDFRTWAGTMLTALSLREFEDFTSLTAAKRNISKAIATVAGRLGNTKAICRKCYVHPRVIDAYLDRSLAKYFKDSARSAARQSSRLSAFECAVLRLVQPRKGSRHQIQTS